MSGRYFKNCVTKCVFPLCVGPEITHVKGCFQRGSISPSDRRWDLCLIYNKQTYTTPRNIFLNDRTMFYSQFSLFSQSLSGI